MNQDYIKANPWSILEEEFDKERVQSSESLFSIGNGAMGQRANFEEDYSGETFQGSYIAGVYYPDKTKVGWWKNGYPEYFAKVLNAPNWIGIHVKINGDVFDLNTCLSVEYFKRELNMKEGYYQRSFTATLPNAIKIEVNSTRFLSLKYEEVGAIKYQIKVLNKDADVQLIPYVDSGITNKDSNWDDKFWNTTNILEKTNGAFIELHTMKTNFKVCTYMNTKVNVGDKEIVQTNTLKEETKIGFEYNASSKRVSK